MATTTAPGSASSAPPLDRKLIAIGMVVVLGTIMSIIDATAVNVARCRWTSAACSCCAPG